MATHTLSLSRPRPRADRAAGRRADADDATADRCLQGVREGDEVAFTRFAARHHRQMVRVARCYVGCTGAAEEVTLEAWSAALRELDRVDEEISPRLWLFRILTNVAMLHAGSEGSCLESRGDAPVGPTLGIDGRCSWTSSPAAWGDAEHRRLDELRAQGAIDDMIDELPFGERLVVTLRDVCRWDAGEIAQLLAISPANVRKLLGGGRRRIHAALATCLRPVAA